MTVDTRDTKGVFIPSWAVADCEGDYRDAAVLAQISWLLQPTQREWRRRTARIVERFEHTWLYVCDAELGEMLGITHDQVFRARKSLKKRGLLDSRSCFIDKNKVTLMRLTACEAGLTDKIAESRFSDAGVNREVATSKSRGRDDKIAESRFSDDPSLYSSIEEQLQEEENKQSREPDPVPAITFDDFWNAYPRKVAKGAAREAWAKMRKDKPHVDPQTVFDGALRYARDPEREPQFTCHPASWLNQERWEDEPLPPRKTGSSNGGGVQPAEPDHWKRPAVTTAREIDMKEYFAKQRESQNGHR